MDMYDAKRHRTPVSHTFSQVQDNNSKVYRQTPISTILKVGRESPVQRLLNILPGNVPQLANQSDTMQSYIMQNSSDRVRQIILNPNIHVNLTFGGGLGPGVAANTDMSITWNDGVVHGPIDLFNANNANIVSTINFAYYVSHRITIDIAVTNPPIGNTTWQGNLLHELEAHTGLANKIDSLIKKRINYKNRGAIRNADTNIKNEIITSINKRNVDNEHYNFAIGGGGGEKAMTATVLNQRDNASKIAVLLDIGRDRINHLDLANQALRLKRINFNEAVNMICKWISTIQKKITNKTQGQINDIHTLLNYNKSKLK